MRSGRLRGALVGVGASGAGDSAGWEAVETDLLVDGGRVTGPHGPHSWPTTIGGGLMQPVMPSLDDFGAVLFTSDLARLLGMSLRNLQRVQKHTPELLPSLMHKLDYKPRYSKVSVAAYLASKPAVARPRAMSVQPAIVRHPQSNSQPWR